jgi:hypothetical protein
MVLFPAIAFLLSLACLVVVGFDAWRKPRPDKIAWTVSFALFALAAAVEVAGGLAEWTPLMARVYYLAGAVLVVGYLALGELYLLAPGKIGRFAPGAALLVTALAATLTLEAPVDQARLATEGWRAIEKGPALIGLAIAINIIGTLILAGGAFWSAWQFRRNPALRSRMIGCILIGVGAMVVASGGSLTRLGSPQYLYIAMAAGVALIFAGYLQARKPAETGLVVQATEGRVVPFTPGRADVSKISTDPGMRVIASWLETLDAEGVRSQCLAWSATPGDEAALARGDARMTWHLRAVLPEQVIPAFDALPISVRRQLAEVYRDVFSDLPGPASGRRAG